MVIWWFFTNYATQTAYVIGGLWVVNGLRKAVLKPRVQYLEHSEIKHHGSLVKIKRQELLPPWRTLEETWLVPYVTGVCVREGDGRSGLACGSTYEESSLSERIKACLKIAQIRKLEAEEAERKLTEELEHNVAKKQKLDDLIARAEVQ